MLGDSASLYRALFMRRLLLTLLFLGSGLAHAGELPETDWLDLMPQSDQKALEAMPEIDHNSPKANGTFTEKGGMKQSKGLPAVMYSTKTVACDERQEHPYRWLSGAVGDRCQRTQYAVLPGAVPGRVHSRAATATESTGAGALSARFEAQLTSTHRCG